MLNARLFFRLLVDQQKQMWTMWLWLQYSTIVYVSNPATECIQPLQRDRRGTVCTEIGFSWRDRRCTKYNSHFQAHKQSVSQILVFTVLPEKTVSTESALLPFHSCLTLLYFSSLHTHTYINTHIQFDLIRIITHNQSLVKIMIR